jgi:uncharacterized membrane protein
MLSVEQTGVIEAPMAKVMQTLNDVERIPIWATVKGVIDNVRGSGQGMTYEWHYSVQGIKFNGQSEVIECSDDTLITKTTGDIASLWTFSLTALNENTTALHVVVEYYPPNKFVEILADKIVQQYATPEVAQDNLNSFKQYVESKD